MIFYERAATPIGSSSIRAPSAHIILHLVDECIRWSTAVDTPTKNAGAIIETIQTDWLKLYGKPELMIWDGE